MYEPLNPCNLNKRRCQQISVQSNYAMHYGAHSTLRCACAVAQTLKIPRRYQTRRSSVSTASLCSVIICSTLRSVSSGRATTRKGPECLKPPSFIFAKKGFNRFWDSTCENPA